MSRKVGHVTGVTLPFQACNSSGERVIRSSAMVHPIQIYNMKQMSCIPSQKFSGDFMTRIEKDIGVQNFDFLWFPN
jgi:hypothetical protein